MRKRLVFVAAPATMLVLTGCQRLDVIDGHGENDQTYDRSLSHTAVERFIDNALGAEGVSCNDGQDFPMRHAGEHFRCVDDKNQEYTVTIKNPDNGTYSVK